MTRELEMPAEMRPDAPVVVEPRPALLVALAAATFLGAFVLGRHASEVALPVLHGVAVALATAVLVQASPSARRADVAIAAVIAVLLHHGALDRMWGTGTPLAIGASALAAVAASQLGLLLRPKRPRVAELAWVLMVATIAAGLALIGTVAVFVVRRGDWLIPVVLAAPALAGLLAQLAADGRIGVAAFAGGAAAVVVLARLELYAMSTLLGGLVAGASCLAGAMAGWLAKGRRQPMPPAFLRR